jgi:AcrR family transcriptional regulator
VANKEVKPKSRKQRDKSGWQAQKSAMTRDTILDAALDCFINIGYASTTTAKIADKAKVSRGAMLHHFPSKTELVQAAVEYLHGKLLYLYAKHIDEAIGEDEVHDLPVDERNRRGLRGYWNYLSSEMFVAYHELCVAGRTDPELQHILEDSIARFDENVVESSGKMFPEWAQRGELFSIASDITKFLMEGMAVSQIISQKDQRVDRMINYLGDRLEEIFHEADDKEGAIHRHSSKG